MLAMPDQSLFGFPPTNNPTPIPPTHEPNSVMHPFNIPDSLFVSALDPKVPLSIAITYAVTIKLLNRLNKARNKKPWGISKTTPFGVFVILHNIFLAVYSAWTFWGMLGGMRRSILSPMGPMGWAGTADSFCRLHGAPGPGNSVFYDEATSSFVSATQGAAMVDGFPDKSQAGRMWNEGLAYYGWIFYLSKFYEVLDTFIILAKGKQSSVLQTYHHAGAMLCMWAGMRFMSAPIWIFVLVNSFIHSLMVSIPLDANFPSPRTNIRPRYANPGLLVHLLHPHSLQHQNPNYHEAHPHQHADYTVRPRRLIRHDALVCVLRRTRHRHP
jgi:hypothetical protein